MVEKRSLTQLNKSQVIISALIILVIVFALGAGLLLHSRSFRDFASMQVDTDKAYSLAKSGMSLADSRVAEDLCNCSGNNTYNFGQGTIDLKIETSLTPVDDGYSVDGNITSTGNFGRSKRRLTKSFHELVKEWAKAYGGTNYEYLKSLQQTSDGYILGGYTLSPPFGAGSYDFLLVKTDALGVLQWAKTYGGTNSDYLYSLQQTSDGYILGGYTESFGTGDRDFLLIKTDASGVLQWAKTYDGGTNYDFLDSLQQTSDGYILGGSTQPFGSGIYDFLLIKTDSFGNLGCCNNVTVKEDPGTGYDDPGIPNFTITTKEDYGTGSDDLSIENFTITTTEDPGDFSLTTTTLCPSLNP
jgi:hypothetical protein